jgi:sulfate permease, SulP family
MNKQPQTQWHLFVPKLWTVLRQGYSPSHFRSDAIAGLTVAIVALPLAMALAIASGTTPDKGLVTAVVAGFLISALGGSRFQIGGPTGAFVVVVFNVIATHGYDGLVLATAMAGIILVIVGWARIGTYIKYIPEPVITGFTAGIAIIIFSSQVKDLLGLSIDKVPADFIDKWHAFWTHRNSLQINSIAVSLGSLAVILLLRRYAPKLPGFLLAVIGGAVVVWMLGLNVPTIGSQFGQIPNLLPIPHLPEFSLSKMREVLPSAFTIAFLAGVESLLSAVIADGMTGRRHRSNCELVAQGVANFASALFGGLPATGAIARTATNIRTGAYSPVAGILHAVFLLMFMMVLAPLCSFIPLPSLAAVLVMVAWNMSERERIRHLMSAPIGDRFVLLITLALTVLVDLTVAIEVGVVLAAILFMHRMAEAVAIQNHSSLIENDEDDFTRKATDYTRGRDLPQGIESLELRGPFFFGVANRLGEILDNINQPPRGFILQLREVPLIDATGVGSLKEFITRCARTQTTVILTAMQPAVARTVKQMGLLRHTNVQLAADYATAINVSRQLTPTNI